MFKDIIAVLAAACLLAVVAAVFLLTPLAFWLTPIPKPLVWAVLVLALIWSAWPLLRHIGRRALIVFASLGLGLALSACSTLGGLGGPGSPGNVQQVVANIKAFNDAASSGPCVGYGNVDWQPPLPPSGALHVQCFIGNPQVQTLKQFGGAAPAPAPAAAPPAAPATTPPSE